MFRINKIMKGTEAHDSISPSEIIIIRYLLRYFSNLLKIKQVIQAAIIMKAEICMLIAIKIIIRAKVHFFSLIASIAIKAMAMLTDILKVLNCEINKVRIINIDSKEFLHKYNLFKNSNIR